MGAKVKCHESRSVSSVDEHDELVASFTSMI